MGSAATVMQGTLLCNEGAALESRIFPSQALFVVFSSSFPYFPIPPSSIVLHRINFRPLTWTGTYTIKISKLLESRPTLRARTDIPTRSIKTSSRMDSYSRV